MKIKIFNSPLRAVVASSKPPLRKRNRRTPTCTRSLNVRSAAAANSCASSVFTSTAWTRTAIAIASTAPSRHWAWKCKMQRKCRRALWRNGRRWRSGGRLKERFSRSRDRANLMTGEWMNWMRSSTVHHGAYIHVCITFSRRYRDFDYRDPAFFRSYKSRSFHRPLNN